MVRPQTAPCPPRLICPLTHTDAPKRSTRGRNPLPPSSGPLFPPLPPKVPKVKPSKSPNLTASNSDSNSLSQSQSQKEGDVYTDGPVTALTEAAVAARDAEGGGSLSPPPGDSVASSGNGARASSALRRGVNAFPKRRAIDVKVEDEPTTGATSNGSVNGNGKSRRYSSHLAPPESAGDSESEAGSTRPKNRRRRGEDQLLLDDHLLPEEMRRTGKISGKRARESNTSAASDGHRPSSRRQSVIAKEEEAEPEVEAEAGDEPAALESGTKPNEERVEAPVPGVQDEPNGKEEQGTDADISEPPPEHDESDAVPAPPEADDEALTEDKPDGEDDPAVDPEVEQDGEGEEEGDDADAGEEMTRCVCQREGMSITALGGFCMPS